MGAGGGKKDAVALEECAKWGGKKAAWERIASRQLLATTSLFFFPSDFVLLKHTSLPPKIPSPYCCTESSSVRPQEWVTTGFCPSAVRLPASQHPLGRKGREPPPKANGAAEGGERQRVNDTAGKIKPPRRLHRKKNQEKKKRNTQTARTQPSRRAENTAISFSRLTAKPPNSAAPAARLKNTPPAEKRRCRRGKENPPRRGSGGPGPQGAHPPRRYLPRGAQTMASPSGEPGPRGIIHKARPGGPCERGAERSRSGPHRSGTTRRPARRCPGGPAGPRRGASASSRRSPPPLAPCPLLCRGCRQRASSPPFLVCPLG